MKLAKGELRPGTVLEILDNHGTIRAEVSGLFSIADREKLPPISPFIIGPSNSFSTPNIGDEVWVLFFTDNARELFWFRKDNFGKNNGSGNAGGEKSTGNGLIQDQQNVEVLSSRESGIGWATIYFSDGTGWIVQNQDAIIEIKTDSISLSTGMPHETISIGDGISLGTKNGSAHPVAHGDKLENLFNNIIDTFEAIAVAAQENPYTIPIATIIDEQLAKYKDDPNFICSEHVTVD